MPDFSHKYTVSIGQGLLGHISDCIDFDSYSSLFIFTDSHVEKLYLNALKQEIIRSAPETKIHSFVFEAGETQKNSDTVNRTYQALLQARADRRTLMILLGGGVVSDMGGFIASTYQRGIPFITIPTTLESMVDASIGGKTAVNLGNYKNYIGVFATPQAVVIDVDTLKTLPNRAYIQGYAEVIKHALILDAGYFAVLAKQKPTSYSSEELVQLIMRSVQLKAEIVRQDPHERGLRKILNFGHTIGHAIESLSLQTAQPLFHGEAVSIGMVAEAYISYRLGMLEEDELKKIVSAIESAGLPVKYKTDSSVDEIVALLYTDKKSEKGSIKWSLLNHIGKAEFNIVVDEKFARDGISYIYETY